MEIFVHTIKDLNRYLNLGLYLLLDSNTIMVNSLTLGTNLLAFNSAQTMDCYLALLDLKSKVTSWALHNMQEKYAQADVVKGQIYVKYKFDITKSYEVKKYGQF